MKWALLFALGSTGAVVVLTCIVVLFLRHRLRRLHRVDPAIRTDAPLTWMVDPRRPAQLHRRLARVGTTTSAVADDHRPVSRRFRKPEPSPLVATAEDVRAQAVALDLQLARVAMLAAGARRAPLADLGRSVAELEDTTARLVRLSAEVRSPRALSTDDPSLAEITQRVDRLAHAHAELLALDEQAGLTTRQA